MPLQRTIVVAVLLAASPSFAAQATLPGAAARATELASSSYGRSAFDEPFAHIEPSPAPAEPVAAETEPAPARSAPAAAVTAPVAAAAEPADAVPVPAAPVAASVTPPAPTTAPTAAKPAARPIGKLVESPLIDPSLPIPEPTILSEPGPDTAAAPVVPLVRVPTAAEREAASRRKAAAAAPRPAATQEQPPVELASASPQPPEVIRAAPAVAVSPAVAPKVIEVPRETQTPRRRHFTADRDQLLREFPDELVEQMWLQDWRDIERGYMFGRLVDVASDPEGRGIVLRLDGESRIGELEDDPYRQMLLCKLAKPAAGLLYRVASRLRLIEGEDYEPLEITSLVRTWDYQLRLSDINPNADRTRDGVPPTHVLGLAFDIARSSMSAERQERVELLLDQLAVEGELAYYKEGSSNGLEHYHVIALPSADLLLARHYEREQQAAERQQQAQARHRTLPDAPCVMFGSSLEPFSAICSCELPVEVSAASLADAPISR